MANKRFKYTPQGSEKTYVIISLGSEFIIDGINLGGPHSSIDVAKSAADSHHQKVEYTKQCLERK